MPNDSVGHADVIFFIYLYQKWIYPVDKKRVNEFGFGGEDDTQISQSSVSGDTAATKEAEATMEGNKKTN